MEIEKSSCNRSSSSSSSGENLSNREIENGEATKKWQEPDYLSVKIPDNVDLSLMTKK
jgi:hypothetical protein